MKMDSDPSEAATLADIVRMAMDDTQKTASVYVNSCSNWLHGATILESVIQTALGLIAGIRGPRNAIIGSTALFLTIAYSNKTLTGERYVYLNIRRWNNS